MSNTSPIAKLFNSIAPSYDFLNHFLSLGIDRRWRRKVLLPIKLDTETQVLDVACGTADLIIEANKQGSYRITGVDISEKMLEVGQRKIAKKGLIGYVHLQQVEGVHLPFPDATFEVVTVAFGVRNFEHRAESLAEMYRVMKTGGTLMVLEFSTPTVFPLKQLYKFYFKCILPIIGGIFSGNKSAYSYLPDSVYAFPNSEDFQKELGCIGWKEMECKPLTGGIASVYYAKK